MFCFMDISPSLSLFINYKIYIKIIHILIINYSIKYRHVFPSLKENPLKKNKTDSNKTTKDGVENLFS